MTVQEFRAALEYARSNKIKGHNSMGCAECWYDPYYLIGAAIKGVDIEALTEREVDLMIRVANFAAEVFY